MNIGSALFEKKSLTAKKTTALPTSAKLQPLTSCAPPLGILFHRRPRIGRSSDDGVSDCVRPACADGTQFDHVIGIKISQLQPVLGDVRRGKQFVFYIFTLQGGQ